MKKSNGDVKKSYLDIFFSIVNNGCNFLSKNSYTEFIIENLNTKSQILFAYVTIKLFWSKMLKKKLKW
jgi:hypothetical protein